jgi:asparagine synthase (glutamine-hydrolysing)
MCGIAGWFDPGGLKDENPLVLLRAMTDRIRHRGPDDEGAWIDAAAGIALGFRRLSILDLTAAGHQPMASASGRYTIVFNGEIYNFRQLRAELAALRHGFRGHSDTEVLLAAVTQWGVRRALERANGMFAFALWDRDTRTLYLGRDRAGEKPLYYGWVDGTLFFGSELKALRRHPRFTVDVDRGVLAHYMRRGYVGAPHSIYRGVHKVLPGTVLAFCAGQREPVLDRYWSWEDEARRGAADPFRGTYAEALDELDALLRDAVRLRLESDVPLGAFLSGGIDSSLIVALMQADAARPVRTFAIGFHERRWNEAPFAAAVARHLGTEHAELYAGIDEALAVVPRLPELYDEPFADPSQIPTFLVAQFARQRVTVCLSGDAGDELFGGYRRYRLGAWLWNAVRHLPRPARRAAARATRGLSHLPEPLRRALDRVARGGTGKRSLSERVRQGEGVLSAESRVELFHYLRSYWKHPEELVPDAVEPLDPVRDPAAGAGLAQFEAEMMYRDAITYLPADILAKVDRATMAVSLEARIPLLDPRVISFASRLPVGLKIRNGTGKRILRDLVHRYVPRRLLERPKRGFVPPLRLWLRGPLRAWAEDLLSEARLRRQGYLEPRIVQRKLREHMSGRTSWDYDLWTVLMFEGWIAAAKLVAGVVLCDVADVGMLLEMADVCVDALMVEP